jgi:hypothetical protein
MEIGGDPSSNLGRGVIPSWNLQGYRFVPDLSKSPLIKLFVRIP